MDYGTHSADSRPAILSDACDALGIDATTSGAMKAVYADANAKRSRSQPKQESR